VADSPKQKTPRLTARVECVPVSEIRVDDVLLTPGFPNRRGVRQHGEHTVTGISLAHGRRHYVLRVGPGQETVFHLDTVLRVLESDAEQTPTPRTEAMMTIEELCEQMAEQVPGDYAVRMERFPADGSGKGEDDITFVVDHVQRVVTLKGVESSDAH
jgi:hypothetical protein